MSRKFKAKPFKSWLDALAALVVKTRDNWTCQIRHEGCQGRLSPGDFAIQCCHIKSRTSNSTRWDLVNLLTGCAHCHQWAHANPHEFGIWFAEKYPARADWPECHPFGTWHAEDFRCWEDFLLRKCIDLEVDYLHMNIRYRDRLRRKLAEMRA